MEGEVRESNGVKLYICILYNDTYMQKALTEVKALSGLDGTSKIELFEYPLNTNSRK